MNCFEMLWDKFFMFVGQSLENLDAGNHSLVLFILVNFHLLQRGSERGRLYYQKYIVLSFAFYRRGSLSSEKEGKFSERPTLSEGSYLDIINLNDYLTSVNDEKTVSGITLSEHIITLFGFSKDHWFGYFLDFLVFEGGKKLMLRETFECKLDLLLFQFVS